MKYFFDNLGTSLVKNSANTGPKLILQGLSNHHPFRLFLDLSSVFFGKFSIRNLAEYSLDF